MNLLLLTLFISTLFVVATILFLRWRYEHTVVREFEAPEPPQPSRLYLITEWHCVRIRPGLICCDKARELSDQLYLTGEAPPLPLPECNQMNCNCHYLRFGDRRTLPERRIKVQKLTSIFSGLGQDRRTNRGRRSGDLVSD